MKFKIRINPVAISDVREIKAYIAEDNPGAAVKIGNPIYSQIERLSEFPEMGASLRAKNCTPNLFGVRVTGLADLGVMTPPININRNPQ